MSKNNINDVKIVKLKSISNEMELGMIKEILDDNNIPYIVKNQGTGSHMRIISGSSPFVTDVMVSQTDLEKAHDLLQAISID